jgi:hypothetical protein
VVLYAMARWRSVLDNVAALGLARRGEALTMWQHVQATGDGVDARARRCEVLGAGSAMRATRGAEQRQGHGRRRTGTRGGDVGS